MRTLQLSLFILFSAQYMFLTIVCRVQVALVLRNGNHVVGLEYTLGICLFTQAVLLWSSIRVLATYLHTPQYHVVFDNDFTTVPFMEKGERPPNWVDLFSQNAQPSTYDESVDLAL